MDESACFVRSFSNPVDVSSEVKEDGPTHDPIHVLTQSISFGRFMSESLAWEKWSTFSHNRYLEEVEKFSKPGSVAQKKAFFEAHYKKRAAMRAAVMLEQANNFTSDASQVGTVNSASVERSLNTELANLNTATAVNQLEKDVSDAVMADTTGADAGNLNVARENDVTDAEQDPKLMEDVNMEECRQVENSKAFKNGDIHDKIMATPAISPKKCDDPRNSTSSSKKRGTNSLSKSSTPGRASKSPLHPSKRLASGQSRNDADVAVSTGNSNDKKKTMSNLLRISINFSSSSGKTNKTSVRMSSDSANTPKTPTRVLKEAADQENLAPSSEIRQSSSSSKLSIHGGISKRATSRIGNKSNNHAYISKYPSLDSNEQTRITQKSVHMSMNFTPSAGEVPKTSPKISRESLTPTRASVNAGSKHASKDPPRDKRAISVNNSVSAAGEKRWPSIPNSLKSSNASGTSTRSSISLCPFSFRCEERAEKRKEFFKKLENKMNSKEAEKSQMQITSKEKAKNVPNKIRQSIDVKAKLNEDSCYESQIPRNYVKKIASSWPQSLKTGRKTFRSTTQNANSRSPRRPSINTESSKNGLMKNNKIPGTTLPKNRHENASPNIQLSVGKVGIPYKHDNGGSVNGGCS